MSQATSLEDKMKRFSNFSESRNDVVKALANKVKTGGVDKADFQKAHDLYKATKFQDLKKLIKSLDTDVAEAIADIISRHDSRSFNSMYPKAKAGDNLTNIIREARLIQVLEILYDYTDQFSKGSLDRFESRDMLDDWKMTRDSVKKIAKQLGGLIEDVVNPPTKTARKRVGIIMVSTRNDPSKFNAKKFKDAVAKDGIEVAGMTVNQLDDPMLDEAIFFVKVGDGRDHMIVKTKAKNKKDALAKIKKEYPRDKVSMDRNSEQGLDEYVFGHPLKI